MLQTSEWALSEWKETAAVGRKGMDKGKKITWIQYVAKPNGKQKERERMHTKSKEESRFE